MMGPMTVDELDRIVKHGRFPVHQDKGISMDELYRLRASLKEREALLKRDELIRMAADRMSEPSITPEEIDEWAKRLAADVADAND